MDQIPSEVPNKVEEIQVNPQSFFQQESPDLQKLGSSQPDLSK
jgi:hypothetical protein